jgi:hypothetical protein
MGRVWAQCCSGGRGVTVGGRGVTLGAVVLRRGSGGGRGFGNVGYELSSR